MRHKLFDMRKINLLIFAFILITTSVNLMAKTDEPAVKNLFIDKKNKIISYELTEAAIVRIRVGSRSGPVYRTLVNWQSQKKGAQVIKWDGMDSSGSFDILNNKDFTYSLNYYLLGKESEIISNTLNSDLVISDNFIGRAPNLLHLSQNHKYHKREHCRDIDVVFELPKNIQRTKQGLPIIKGIVPVRIKLPDKDKLWYRAERFSINIFIDDIFVKGEALGYAPYTWNFNPQGINKGSHLITVNLKGFNDHIGVGSLPVYIEPALVSKE